jgi:hypothetical protein
MSNRLLEMFETKRSELSDHHGQPKDGILPEKECGRAPELSHMCGL